MYLNHKWHLLIVRILRIFSREEFTSDQEKTWWVFFHKSNNYRTHIDINRSKVQTRFYINPPSKKDLLNLSIMSSVPDSICIAARTSCTELIKCLQPTLLAVAFWPKSHLYLERCPFAFSLPCQALGLSWKNDSLATALPKVWSWKTNSTGH